MKRGAAGVAEAVKRPKRAAAAAAAAPAPSSEPAAAAAPKQPYAPRSTPAARRRSVPADPDTSVKRNADGSLHFPDHPEFRPRLTPRQVIQAGSWGGCYFNPIGGKPGIHGPVAVSWKDHPSEWFAGLPESMHSSRRYNVPTNFYGVKSGQGQKEWEVRTELWPGPAWRLFLQAHVLPLVRSRSRAGFGSRTRAAFFSGTADSSWAGGRRMTRAKSAAGRASRARREGGRTLS